MKKHPKFDELEHLFDGKAEFTLPEEEYKSKHEGEFNAQMQRFGDLYEQAKKVMKLNN